MPRTPSACALSFTPPSSWAPCSQSRWYAARQAIDSAFLQFTVAQTLQRTASVHLLFAFEYVIQASIIISTFCKYTLAAVDRCRIPTLLRLFGPACRKWCRRSLSSTANALRIGKHQILKSLM